MKIISTVVWVPSPCTGWFYYTGGWNVLCSISKGAAQARHKSVSKCLEPHILGMQARGIPTWSVFRQRGDYGLERKGVQKFQLGAEKEHSSSRRGESLILYLYSLIKQGDFSLLSVIWQYLLEVNISGWFPEMVLETGLLISRQFKRSRFWSHLQRVCPGVLLWTAMDLCSAMQNGVNSYLNVLFELQKKEGCTEWFISVYVASLTIKMHS